ncbi:hypothetical protein DL1_14175 [Thioclava dalianensis]|uniref:YjiS-like domain-containing protein n=1 Tax=Thioclava dalianensis TaxID=1185766 RepID=A0A074TH04_9RHOB|nr:DUF1127 domain-containing protein [Thioclava dalianensis]KEP70949.1 hypothetical protein DL1_14175 [Thioclava dalianensis]SFN14266.1 protein of unknown function [Thioclava dalianensis]
MALVQDIRVSENGLSAVMTKVSEAFARRKVYRQTLGELRSLSARELDDLGLHASMITRVAYEAAYGK